MDHVLSELSTMTWNVRFMNQGKLEVVKQEMARLYVNMLGISKLRWTGMSEFNSDEDPDSAWERKTGKPKMISIRCGQGHPRGTE